MLKARIPDQWWMGPLSGSHIIDGRFQDPRNKRPGKREMLVMVLPLVSFWNMAFRPISYLGAILACQVMPNLYPTVKIFPGLGS
jgi:hypothetical protein